MKILGIHDGHNGSVCLLEDGKIVYAIQEERLTRQKNAPGFPVNALKATLAQGSLQPGDIDKVILSSYYVGFWTGKTREELIDGFGQLNTPTGILKRTVRTNPMYQAFAPKIIYPRRVAALKEQGFKGKQIDTVDHHLSHAAAAYYGLETDDNPYLILTLDGGGDNLCATVSIAEKGQIKRIAKTAAANSLGNIYSRTTYMLGFVPWEHEYKLMGMAPYVPDEVAQKYAEVFKQYLDLDPKNPLKFKRAFREDTGRILKRLEKDLYRVRFDWVCAGLQAFTEDLIIRWVKATIQKTGIRRLICSGGVFMNVKANQKILELPEVESAMILPSCGDETNSVGAAYLGYLDARKKQKNLPAPEPLRALYLGNEITDEEVKNELENFEFDTPVKWTHLDNIEQRIAELLADNQIVARAKGRMEFGARAMGNRSILANPASRESVRIINEMIKSRDFWMPFAPSLLGERAGDYYIKRKAIQAPYMIITFDSRPEMREKFISACHPYDFTCRPQEVYPDWNPDYWQVIKHVEEKTGEGIVLNTSFNIHGEPIVSTVREALDVLNRSGLIYLAVGNYLVEKQNTDSDSA